MVILYVAMKHDYGKPEQGLSFEHWNFYDALARMGHTILYFDFMTLLERRGRAGMNRRLLEVARTERPALMFTVLFRDEIEAAVVRRLPDEAGMVTLNWFCDDQWRFDDFSRRWTPFFTWVVTTASSALPRYARAGLRNVIKSQWACNHFAYRRLPGVPLKYDVTFIGQPHGGRREIILALREAGLDIKVWGQGWDSGRLPQEQMIEVFNQSRVNLNLAGSSSAPLSFAARLGTQARCRVSAAIGALPGGAGIKSFARRALAAARASTPGAPGPRSAPPRPTPYPSQMKGRNFEVPGCGGFLLTDAAEDLQDYYEAGREIALFDGLPDLIGRVRHFLRHEEERAAIARAGYERTMREHTYVHRFCDIFRAAGLPAAPAESLLAGVKPGETVEIG